MENISETGTESLYVLPLSDEEIAAIERARTMPITFDDDCPETTPERAIRFRRVNPVRQYVN